MSDFLQYIDPRLLLAINGSHTPLLDDVMWWISVHRLNEWVTHRYFGSQNFESSRP